jgi:hypothetical protein
MARVLTQLLAERKSRQITKGYSANELQPNLILTLGT